jgi:hypothetical protein
VSQSTTTAPSEQPAPARPQLTTLQKVAYWVVIVVGILVGLHLIAADVVAFQILSSIGEAFGGEGGGEFAPPVGEFAPSDTSYCEVLTQEELPFYPECTD